jgi:hypothetical protein
MENDDIKEVTTENDDIKEIPSHLMFAKRELDMLLPTDKDESDNDYLYQKMINNAVMELMEKFYDQGHSAFSASVTASLFNKLTKNKPLSPLTGDDSEWGDEIDYDGSQQNVRCYSVFRTNHDNSTAYDIDRFAFSDDDGRSWFSAGWLEKLLNLDNSITFPYTPLRERVYVKKTSKDGEDDTYEIIKREVV